MNSSIIADKGLLTACNRGGMEPLPAGRQRAMSMGGGGLPVRQPDVMDSTPAFPADGGRHCRCGL